MVRPSTLKNGRGVCKNCADEIRNENGEGQHCVVNEILAYIHRRVVSDWHFTGKREEIMSAGKREK